MLGIDGDLLVYRVGFAAQKNVYSVYLKDEEQEGTLATIEGKAALNQWLKDTGLEEEDVTVQHRLVVDPVENALHSVKLMIEGMKKKLKDINYKVYLTGSDNFRHDILPSYKGGRGPKPELYHDIRDYLIGIHEAEVIHGMEADDALGIALYTGEIDVLCSYDKDLDMIPGDHYDFIKENFYYVDEEQADKFYHAQLLAGDGVDNICGIKGVGLKTAYKLLDKEPTKSYYSTVQQAYQEYWGDGWEEVLECNEQLIWIKRNVE